MRLFFQTGVVGVLAFALGVAGATAACNLPDGTIITVTLGVGDTIYVNNNDNAADDGETAPDGIEDLDNGFLSSADSDLISITFTAGGVIAGGDTTTGTLTLPGFVKMWNNQRKQTEISQRSWEITPGFSRTYYLEGISGGSGSVTWQCVGAGDCSVESELVSPSVVLVVNVSGDLTEGDNEVFASSYGIPNNFLGSATPAQHSALGYFGRIELVGSVTAGSPSSGYVFKQHVEAYNYFTFIGEPGTVDEDNESFDETLSSQSTVDGAGKIFATDPPGVLTETFGMDKAVFRANFTSWVELSGVRVSNKVDWHTQVTVNPGPTPSTPMGPGTGHITIPLAPVN